MTLSITTLKISMTNIMTLGIIALRYQQSAEYYLC
jgi:hypothetical protein